MSSLRRPFDLVAIAAIAAAVLSAQASAEDSWSVVVDPGNSLNFMLAKNQKPVGQLLVIGWGPSWGWVGVEGHDKAKGDRLDTGYTMVVDQAKGQVLHIKLQAQKIGPRQISFRYDLQADKDVPLTLVTACLSGGDKGKLVLNHQGGGQTRHDLPIGRYEGTPPVSTGVLDMTGLGKVALGFEPPCPVEFDGSARIVLAKDVFKQGSKSLTLTLTFPTEADFLGSPEAMQKLTRTIAGPDWFPFHPSGKLVSGAIGMDDWLDKPAGKRGGVRMVGDHFEFADGTPVKFWGVNLAYGGGCARRRKTAN